MQCAHLKIWPTRPAVLLCPFKISSLSRAVALLSTQPVLAKQSLQWPGFCSQHQKPAPPYYAVCTVCSSHHAFQLVPDTRFAAALLKKVSVWHSHKNIICCVHICIYSNNGSSSRCSRKKIVARQGADHLAPAQNIWTTSAVGLCMFDIPGSK